MGGLSSTASAGAEPLSLSPGEVTAVLERARIPEHSVPFMAAVSGGEPFAIGAFLFYAREDWLIAVGYPLGDGETDGFEAALAEALRRTRARDCWAIAPRLPSRLADRREEADRYLVLSLAARIPPRLERLAERAAARLAVEETVEFDGAHRRLWAEFMSRVALPPRVRELYARTPAVLGRTPGLALLSARDPEGRVAASLLIDRAPRRFTSYLLGAHSREAYTPHATDLLFREMIRAARREGKEFLHLGLGVNEGIRRFKEKWGAAAGPAYEMAAWREEECWRGEMSDLARLLARLPREPLSRQEFLASLPRERRYAMLWEVERDGRRSFLGGTAHFFGFRFERSFRRLFEEVQTVLFEGPLDPASLESVARIGRAPEPGGPRLTALLAEEEIARLERVVCGPRGRWARFFGFEHPDPPDVRGLLAATRPWYAFFSLWTAFVGRRGWKESVDLEAWRIAGEMGKTVIAMETLAEQIETLEGIPLSRIVNFLRGCRRWGRMMRRYERFYLRGDLDRLFGTSIEFPTRTELVIHRRDARFLERMRSYLVEGGSAVFVGAAHLVGLRGMLAEAGFQVRRRR